MYDKFGKRLRVNLEDFLKINRLFRHQITCATPPASQCKVAEVRCARSNLFFTGTLPEVINKSLICIVANLVKANWEDFAAFLGQNATDIPQYIPRKVKKKFS